MLARHATPLLAALALVGCGPTVDYIGQSYPPNPHVAVFMEAKDVPRPYAIMGTCTVTAGEGMRAGKMQDAMMEEARMRGADAVLLQGLDVVTTGQSTTWREDESTDAGSEGEVKKTRRKEKWETEDSQDRHLSGRETTTVHRQKKLRALFLKYK
ncbi:MAG: hypothetical protein ACLF0G_14720 [Candidatus Brocadiia bacterium]